MRLWVIATLLSFSVGCTSSSFDCKRQNGVSCKSLYEVNDMINHHQIDHNGVKSTKHSKRSLIGEKAAVPIQSGKSLSVQSEAGPVRIPEKVASIKIYPYQTKDGVYHQGTRLHVVLDEAKWI